MKRTEIKNEKGAIMLEALIVYPVTLCLLFMILAIFSVLYQRWNIQTIANDAASRMAQSYRFVEAEEMTGEVTKDQLVTISPYRYLFGKETQKASIGRRISSYAGWRLLKTTYANYEEDPTYHITVDSDTLGRRHVNVEVTARYKVPFGEIMTMYGYDSSMETKVTARAECVDLIDYVNTVDFVKNQAKLGFLGSKSVSLIDSVLKLFGDSIDSAKDRSDMSGAW